MKKDLDALAARMTALVKLVQLARRHDPKSELDEARAIAGEAEARFNMLRDLATRAESAAPEGAERRKKLLKMYAAEAKFVCVFSDNGRIPTEEECALLNEWMHCVPPLEIMQMVNYMRA